MKKNLFEKASKPWIGGFYYILNGVKQLDVDNGEILLYFSPNIKWFNFYGTKIHKNSLNIGYGMIIGDE